MGPREALDHCGTVRWLSLQLGKNRGQKAKSQSWRKKSRGWRHSRSKRATALGWADSDLPACRWQSGCPALMDADSRGSTWRRNLGKCSENKNTHLSLIVKKNDCVIVVSLSVSLSVTCLCCRFIISVMGNSFSWSSQVWRSSSFIYSSSWNCSSRAVCCVTLCSVLAQNEIKTEEEEEVDLSCGGQIDIITAGKKM